MIGRRARPAGHLSNPIPVIPTWRRFASLIVFALAARHRLRG